MMVESLSLIRRCSNACRILKLSEAHKCPRSLQRDPANTLTLLNADLG